MRKLEYKEPEKNTRTIRVVLIIITYAAKSSLTSLRRRRKGPKYKRPFSINNRERGSQARGYPAQDTSGMEKARVK